MATRYSPLDWSNTHRQKLSTAAEQRSTSRGHRDHSKNLAKRADAHLAQKQDNVKRSLDERLKEIDTLREKLEYAKGACYTEIGRGIVAADEISSQLEFTRSIPTETAKHNLETREQRPSTDLVDDDVEDALQAEVEAINNVALTLESLHRRCMDQVIDLKRIVNNIDLDLDDKQSAGNIDAHTSRLHKTSNNLGLFKETVKANPRDHVQPEDWSNFSESHIARAKKSVASSESLGREIHSTLQKCQDTLKFHRDKVEDALVERIAEVEDAKKTGDHNLAETREDIFEQKQMIQQLETAITQKDRPLELATTRLQQRALRPSVERVRDSVHHSLVEEAETIEQAQNELSQELYQAEENLQKLKLSASELEEDNRDKKQALRLDKECLARRRLYKSHKPRKTDYTISRPPRDWQSYGRAHSVNL